MASTTTSSHKAIYEEAQLRSSIRTGSILYQLDASERSGVGGSGERRRNTNTTNPNNNRNRSSLTTSWRSTYSQTANGIDSGGSNHQHEYDSSFLLRSSINTAQSNSVVPLSHSTTNTPSSSMSHRSNNLFHNNNTTSLFKRSTTNQQVTISPSGHKLIKIRIHPEELYSNGEDDPIELDRDEIRMLARGGTIGDDPIQNEFVGGDNGNRGVWGNDTSTIGSVSWPNNNSNNNTTTTQHGGTAQHRQTTRIITTHPYPIHLSHDNTTTTAAQKKEKLKQFYTSPPFRRSFFFGMAALLVGLCVFFVLYTTTAAMMGVQDWTEPGYSSVGGIGGGSNHNGDGGYGGGGSDGSGSNGGFIYKDYNNANNNHNNNNNNNAPNPIPPSSYNKDGSQGGIDWNIGPDAPPPIPGASLSPILKHHLADWPSGTHRLLHGGIAMEEAVLFRELPYFWGESFAGMEVLEDVLGNCFKLVLASDLGKAALNSVGNEGHNPSSVLEEEEADDESNLLSIVTILARQYVNVDLTTQPGIDRASVLALSSSGMADVVYSPHLTEMTFKIFDSDHRGRMFVLMMHPVLREFKRFRHLRRMSMVTSSNNNHDNGSSEGEDIRSMTYVTYAESDYVSSNWMTRNLVNKLDPKEELTVTDMHTAKEVLRSKAVVGLHDDFLGAMRHYARYFGWDNGATGEKLSDTLTCMGTAIMEGMMRENMEEELINNDSNIGRGSEGAGGTDGENMGSAPLDKEDAVEGSTAWKILFERNKFDVELYIYSQLLYKYQMGLS